MVKNNVGMKFLYGMKRSLLVKKYKPKLYLKFIF